jgi:hypothetical protein
MERCDVELQPWIPDDLRKTLERRVIEEQEAEKRKHMYAIELQRQIQESTAKQQIALEEAAERKRLEEAELQRSFEAAAAALQRSIEEKAAEKKKFEEAIELKIAEAKESMRLETEAQAQAEASLLAERLRVLESTLQERTKPSRDSGSTSVRATQIPLSTLLKNYIVVLLKDQRNFIILVLGALVVFLAMNMDTGANSQLASISAQSSPQEVVQVVTVTSTAMVTTIEFTTAYSASTITVTETPSATSVQEVVAPTSASAVPQTIEEIVEEFMSVVEEQTVEDIVEDSTPVFDGEDEQPLLEERTSTTSLAEQIFETSEPASTLIEESTQVVVEEVGSKPLSIIEERFTVKNFCAAEPIFQQTVAQCAA